MCRYHKTRPKMSRRTQNMKDIDVIPKKRRRKALPSSDEESEPEYSNAMQQVEDAEMEEEVSLLLLFRWFSITFSGLFQEENYSNKENMLTSQESQSYEDEVSVLFCSLVKLTLMGSHSRIMTRMLSNVAASRRWNCVISCVMPTWKSISMHTLTCWWGITEVVNRLSSQLLPLDSGRMLVQLIVARVLKVCWHIWESELF